jgi:hypothetical protein
MMLQREFIRELLRYYEKSIQDTDRHFITCDLITLCSSNLKTSGKTVKKLEVYRLVILLCKHRKHNLGNPALSYNQ